MDETDVKILKQILLDARLSYRKIGEKIGVSPPTVLSRVQKLEKKRIITSYSAILDHEKLGYDLTAIIEVTVYKRQGYRSGKTHINVSKRVCRILYYWINGHDNNCKIQKSQRT